MGVAISRSDSVEALFDAIDAGRTKETLALINHLGIDVVGQRFFQDQTPLHWASIRGLPDVMQSMVDQGAEVDAEDGKGRTALQLCAIGWNSLEDQDRLQCVKFLVAAGAKIDHRDKEGNTVLHLACGQGHVDILKYLLGLQVASLLSVKNMDGETALHWTAARRGTIDDNPIDLVRNEEQIHAWIDNFLRTQEDQDDHQAWCLREEDRLQCLQVLLEHGADVGQVDNKGETVLHHAAWEGFPSIVKYLLEIRPSLSMVSTNCGQTALHLAADIAHVGIISDLVQHGADVNALNWWKRSPLHHAIGWSSTSAKEEDRLECVKALLQEGANVRLQDRGGDTVLHLAARKEYLSIVQHLLGEDASLAAMTNEDGKIPSEIASTKEVEESEETDTTGEN